MRRRNSLSTSCRVVTILSLIVLFISSIPTLAEARDKRKLTQIGENKYVFSLPDTWKKEFLENQMTLHYSTYPVLDLKGRFIVYVRDRGASPPEQWIDFHRQENLATYYGAFTIEREETVSAGSHNAHIYHLVDLEGRNGYAAADVLIFTEAHVIFISYLYDSYESDTVLEELISILDSFSSDPAQVKKASVLYDYGRSISFCKLGLFLRMPEAWIPDDPGCTQKLITAKLPSNGALQVIGFMRVSKGIDSVKDLTQDHIKGLEFSEEMETIEFGTARAEAFRVKAKIKKNNKEVNCILGLVDRGGYALVLSSNSEEETDLLRRIAANALLLDPKGAQEMRLAALERFKDALKRKDDDAVCDALSTLELFSNCDKTARKIKDGFKSTTPIQKECALSIGRMACPCARSLLEKPLKDKKVCDSTKRACIKGLTMIGTDKARKTLEGLKKKTPQGFSDELKEAINESLRNFSSEPKRKNKKSRRR